MPFDQIQQAVADGRVDAGLLIHEGQLTYRAEGCTRSWTWASGGSSGPAGCRCRSAATSSGAISGRRRCRRCRRCCTTASRTRSANRAAAVEYAQQFGRGLDRRDTDTFVGMYVNQLTLDYGTRGRAALERFFADAYASI